MPNNIKANILIVVGNKNRSKINNLIIVIPIAVNPIYLSVKSFTLIEMKIYIVPVIAHIIPHIVLVIGS
jgi:hypothetical protein